MGPRSCATCGATSVGSPWRGACRARWSRRIRRGDVDLPESPNPEEPYRRRLTSMWERLGADDYADVEELRAELDLVETSLREHGGERIAGGGLAALRRRLDVFGLRPDARLPRLPRARSSTSRTRCAPSSPRRRRSRPARRAVHRHADRLDDPDRRGRARGRGARRRGPAGRRCRPAARDDRRPPRCPRPRRRGARPVAAERLG